MNIQIANFGFAVETPSTKRLLQWSLLVMLALVMTLAHAAPPLKIGYGDWPGYTAWQIAIEKGWLKEAGVDAEFEWFDYSASMEAYSANKLDADLVTNGDALVTGAGGAKGTMIALLDYSNGNDMIVAKPGIKTLQDLKGKKVAVEQGLVEHLLLLNGLKKAGMQESDVTIVNAKTNEMPQVLASGDVSAIGAWQPISGQAIKDVPGSKAVYTSADEPGLIYDVMLVNPASLSARKADWQKLLTVWDRVVAYVNDPKTRPDAIAIMSARVGVPAAQYASFLDGTHLISLKEGKSTFVKAAGFKSLNGSTKIADDFNVKNAVYKVAQNVDSYLDSSLTDAAAK